MEFLHIGIRVSDVKASLKFYTQVLGCKVLNIEERPGMQLIFMNAHGVTIELIYKEGYELREVGPVEHLAFRVQKLDEKLAELKEHGIELDAPPRQSGTNKIAFFTGPNKERIEYSQIL